MNNIIAFLQSYRTRAIITRGLYIFYPLFEVHLCTVTWLIFFFIYIFYKYKYVFRILYLALYSEDFER